MRIGILTQPLHNNYGGLLQNYALQQVLKRMGHEVETIDYGSKKHTFIYRYISIIKLKLLCLLYPEQYKKPEYVPQKEELAIIRRETNCFIDKYITRTKLLHSEKDFENIAKEGNYKAYIVGSDQCWRPRYNGSFLYEMFLQFAERQKDIKRIAYAASFGTDVWEMNSSMTNVCSQLVKKFDIITVREKSGVDLCREHLGVVATHVLDPTMLLKREDYEKLIIAENEGKSDGTLFHYILDPSSEKKTLIERAAKENGMRSFTVMPKCQAENRTEWDIKHRIEDCVFPSVTSWLRGFWDAEMVIVDSFHGAVFSIIFNKPFWVIGNNYRGNARFKSLLELYGLEDRMITPQDNIDWKKAIDWENVNMIREKEAKRSLNILSDAL